MINNIQITNTKVVYDYYLNILKALAKEHAFSVDVPVKKLSPKALEIIFYGPDKKEIKVEQRNDMGGLKQIEVPFEGVAAILKKKYEEST